MDVPSLDNTFGMLLISVILSGVLYGVSCAQVFYYFQQYSEKDGRGTKAVVILILICDTIHQALISHTIYHYLVTNYAQPLKLGDIVWSLVVEVMFNGITAFLVQTFYAVRIYKFSQRNIIITATLGVFIVGEFVTISIYVARAMRIPTFAELAVLTPLAITTQVLTAVGDILITVVFCILLNRARNNMKRSNTMINLLIAFSVQTGMLTSLCALASLIAILASPNTFIYIFFYFLMGRFYFNSLLGTLNVRRAIRGRGHGDLGISLQPIESSGTSSAENRKGIKVEITHEYLTGSQADRGAGDSTPHNDSSRLPDAEFELESGRPQSLKQASSF